MWGLLCVLSVGCALSITTSAQTQYHREFVAGDFSAAAETVTAQLTREPEALLLRANALQMIATRREDAVASYSQALNLLPTVITVFWV